MIDGEGVAVVSSSGAAGAAVVEMTAVEAIVEATAPGDVAAVVDVPGPTPAVEATVPGAPAAAVDMTVGPTAVEATAPGAGTDPSATMTAAVAVMSG